MKQRTFNRVELEMDALEAIVDRARSALSEEEHRQLKGVLETLGRLTQELEKKRTSIYRLRELLFGPRTEKTAAVLNNKQRSSSAGSQSRSNGKRKKIKGHGRHKAADYKGAKRIAVPHESLKSGAPCPQTDCTGKVYPLKEPGVIVRIKGMPPLPATVYELEKLRCNPCGTVFTATAPEGISEQKYDETAVSLIALLKYGAGFPFNRLEQLEANFGIPLPATTQWDLVDSAATQLAPLFEHYIDEAAQGEVLHNDDTPMKILDLMKENEDRENTSQRTGMFTSGVISKCGDNLVALFFTGRNHAGENLSRILANRAEQLEAPIQMCDALSRNKPAEFETILANCLGHGRRKFVEQVTNFPQDCRYILEALGKVYAYDAIARDRKMSPDARLQFHQENSKPLMADLHQWFEKQFEEKLIEPNSGLGEAIAYMLKYWQALTLFLRAAGAPLDNNICERALKKAILHRKNALFYKTQNGARVGDLFMSLIHTTELAGINAFDYLCALQRHAEKVSEDPGQWMPWKYQQTLQHIGTKPADHA